MVLWSVLGSQDGSSVSTRSTQVPWHAKPRALQFSSSLRISIMPCSSLNCGLSSTSIFFSNYIDFSKLQCPSVDFQLCITKTSNVWEKTNSLCSCKVFYAIRPFMEQNRVKNIWNYCSYYKNKQKLSFLINIDFTSITQKRKTSQLSGAPAP